MKFTTDNSVRRLRWVMVGAMIFDKLNTLFGQRRTYWQHPETSNEGNPFFAFFLSRGWPTYVLFSLVYVAAIWLLVSLLPRRPALITLFAFILGHYFGACTWLSYHWHFGILGPIMYAIILGTVLVWLEFPNPKQTPT